MKTAAQLLPQLTPQTFKPVIIHGEPPTAVPVGSERSSLETLQIALAFIVGSAMALVTLLL